jgi:hypothetical protein
MADKMVRKDEDCENLKELIEIADRPVTTLRGSAY